MDKAPGEPIGGRDHYRLEFPALGRIPQPIQGRTVNPCSTVSFISVQVVRLKDPSLCLHSGLYALDLLCDGLLLSLPLG
jgi:hypothetical protein